MNNHNNHPHDSHEESATVYTCPMHPEVRQKRAGKCPGCGMDLIPVSAKATAGTPEKNEAHSKHADHDMQKMNHADHEAAMTNPQIAKKMEADMRRRFFVSLLLSIPIFLYSPVATSFRRRSR